MIKQSSWSLRPPNFIPYVKGSLKNIFGEPLAYKKGVTINEYY